MAFQIYDHLQDEEKLICKILLELGECDLKMLSDIKYDLNLGWTQEELIYILLRVTEGLEAMRKMRFCHLDVKHKNVVISFDD